MMNINEKIKVESCHLSPILILFTLLWLVLNFTACKNSSLIEPFNLLDKGYDYYYVGSQSDVSPVTSSGFVLMGGGSDVDDAFRWMIQKSGGGDFVVIRAQGSDAYNSYIAGLGAVDSVETLVIYKRHGADDPFVVNKVKNAEALFIAGGDQSDYLRLWKGTLLNEAINYVINRGAVVGGTSAGLAVLGEYIFAAYNGTVYSNEALANPYNFYITLDRNFLTIPLLQKTITDSHFVTRNRMGRLIVFLARIIKDGWTSEAKGIGVDEATALLVEPDGLVRLVGSRNAYFLRADRMPEVCQHSTPLTYSMIRVYRIGAGNTFNLITWQGNGGLAYFISAISGALSSSTGSIY